MENRNFINSSQSANSQPSTSGQKRPHTISIERCEKAVLNGVEKVVSSNENIVSLLTTEGALVLNGSGFRIVKFDGESGHLILEGRVKNLKYSSESVDKGGVFKKIFK